METLPDNLPVGGTFSLLRRVGAVDLNSLRITRLRRRQSLTMTEAMLSHRFRIRVKFLHDLLDSSKTLNGLGSVAFHLPIKQGIFHLSGGSSELVGGQRETLIRLSMGDMNQQYRGCRGHMDFRQLNLCSGGGVQVTGIRLGWRVDLSTR